MPRLAGLSSLRCLNIRKKNIALIKRNFKGFMNVVSKIRPY
jgi:hypothetical protein